MDAALENAHPQSVKSDVHAVAHCGDARRFKREHAHIGARAFRVAGRQVEELVPPTATLAGSALQERPGRVMTGAPFMAMAVSKGAFGSSEISAVHGIAVKAIEGASGVKALSHINQIAVEQAKNRPQG